MIFKKKNRIKNSEQITAETEEKIHDSTEKVEEKDIIAELKKSIPVRILFVLLLISLPVFIISIFSESFSEFYSRTIGSAIRMVLAKISGIFPFSVAELVFVIATVFIIYGIVRGIAEIFIKSKSREQFELFFDKILLCFVIFCFSVNNLAFAACSRRTPLEENLGLEKKEVSAQQLYECMLLVTEKLEECIDSGIRYDADGLSCLPYSFESLDVLLNEVYDKACGKYTFLSRFKAPAKRLATSSLVTYTHISGIYVPFTGEVNINTNYPHYVITFSQAHEMAHQRGLAREDEANFMAFIVLYESGDNYLKYSALLSLYDYLASALSEAEPQLFYEVMYGTNPKILGEIIAFANFFTEYEDSAASTVMGAVNDVSIKLRGDSDGAKSYNMMVDLAVSYFGIE